MLFQSLKIVGFRLLVFEMSQNSSIYSHFEIMTTSTAGGMRCPYKGPITGSG